MRTFMVVFFVVGILAAAALPVHAGQQRSFEEGSLIVPMDLSCQNHGMFQAYGLVFQLLRHGVTVYWVIDPDKSWHHAPCDTAGDECDWDCFEEGSEVKCPYPTGSPDFYTGARVVWDGEGRQEPGDVIELHGYRGGPFVIDSADGEAALAVIEAWNDQDAWDDNPWARRSIFQVVTVHEVTAAFEGYARKEMIAAPTIAVFSDGNENIAAGYLRAAGIPQSNGLEFPADKCGQDDCGPGTDNPDMLTVESIMGDMGTCDEPNYDHKNGALFSADGVPAYCQIMSMHWNVGDRETVECDGGGCPASQDDCAGQRFTYHGHEVVAEVRQFLAYPTHFFAECQAANAYENTVPDPSWPFLDDPGRNGHFLTTTGIPPSCPCTEGDFECVAGGCDAGGRDCCLPKNAKERGAGFLIADQPNSDSLQILHPGVPYNQLDGAFATVGGSEPAYNLSSYLQTGYKNDMDITFITGPDGPGDQDVWMTGYMEGECWIGDDDTQHQPGQCTMGKVSYLGGHAYKTDVPLGDNPNSQGARLFLNALFEADCVTSIGQPNITLRLGGETSLGARTLPVESTYTATYTNLGSGTALDAVLALALPAGSSASEFESGGSATGDGVAWEIGSIGSQTGPAGDPPHTGSRWTKLSFSDYGEYRLEIRMEYRVGVSIMQAEPGVITVRVLPDSDGDTIPDELDPDPDDPHACGDSDGDTCDDCSVTGLPNPSNDGPDRDGDGICDAGDTDGDEDPEGKASGCGCGQPAPAGAGLLLLFLLLAMVFRLQGRRG